MFDIIKGRRSVRQYTGEPVSEKEVILLLEAAMNAPSAGNEQAWSFIVLRDAAVRTAVADINRNAAYIAGAPVGILVCADLSREKYEGYHVHDCSAATLNILLAAHSMGLGAVWCTVFPDGIEPVRKLLNLPEKIIPFSIIPIGHPQKNPVVQSRFDQNRVHYDRW